MKKKTGKGPKGTRAPASTMDDPRVNIDFRMPILPVAPGVGKCVASKSVSSIFASHVETSLDAFKVPDLKVTPQKNGQPTQAPTTIVRRSTVDHGPISRGKIDVKKSTRDEVAIRHVAVVGSRQGGSISCFSTSTRSIGSSTTICGGKQGSYKSPAGSMAIQRHSSE